MMHGGQKRQRARATVHQKESRASLKLPSAECPFAAPSCSVLREACHDRAEPGPSFPRFSIPLVQYLSYPPVHPNLSRSVALALFLSTHWLTASPLVSSSPGVVPAGWEPPWFPKQASCAFSARSQNLPGRKQTLCRCACVRDCNTAHQQSNNYNYRVLVSAHPVQRFLASASVAPP